MIGRMSATGISGFATRHSHALAAVVWITPAAKAGLASGDIITALNGAPVKDDRELMRTVAELPPGSAVTLGILRKGQEQTITLTLGALPKQRGEVPPAGHQ